MSEKIQQTKGIKKSVVAGGRPQLPSPTKYTQFSHFQILLWAGLALSIFLLEGSRHWQTGVFFIAVLIAALVIRELIWGSRDLLQDELVVRDDHESIWLFVFGRMVQNTEEHAAERKRLLEVTGSGRKFLIRLAVIGLAVLYFIWMKNRGAIQFRPSAFLYIMMFTILISTVFSSQYWAALLVAAVVTVFAARGEWGEVPMVFGAFLVLFFAALGSYRQVGIEWIYAHERDFKKWTRGPGVISAIVLVAVLGLASLWVFDQILPDSLRQERQGRVARRVDSLKRKMQEKLADRLVGPDAGGDSAPAPAGGSATPGFGLSSSQQQGSQILQKMVGTDHQTANELATRLSPEELQALGRMASVSSRYQTAMGAPSVDTPSGMGGGRDEKSLRSGNPGLDPEAWEKFLEQIRQNPDSQRALQQRYPELKQDIERMSGGHAPRKELAGKLEDEFLRQAGPLASQSALEQKKFSELSRKLGLNEEQLRQVMGGKRLDEQSLKNFASEVAMTKPLYGDSRQQGDVSGSNSGQGGGAVPEMESQSGAIDKGRGKGQGRSETGPIAPAVDETGRLKPVPLTREQRKEKVRLQVENTFKFLENAGIALLYLGGIYLIFILLSKFTEKQKEETKPAGRLNRDEKKSLLSELKAIHSRPLSPSEEVLRCYRLFLRMMELVQYPKGQEITPVHFAEEVVARFPHLKKPVPYVSEVFCQVFYGKLEVGAETLKEFRSQFRSVFQQFGLRVQ